MGPFTPHRVCHHVVKNIRVSVPSVSRNMLLARSSPRFLQGSLFRPWIISRLSHHSASATHKVTIPQLYQLASENRKFVTLTAHDSISARMAEQGGVDVVLVGDSLSMVAMGYEDTSEITLEDMIYHTRAVRRGAKKPLIITDLPFGSYEKGPTHAMDSAIQLIKKGKAEVVKMEGGRELAPTIKALSSYGIATCPHIGLTPQRQIATGGFKVQGKDAESALSVLEDALALQEAGATFFLLEGVPARVAEIITREVKIPVIGIGAGPHTDSQVLVQLDMLGGFDNFSPKFVKKYANLLQYTTSAISNYVQEVRGGQFPTREHSYVMKSEEYHKFLDLVASKK